MPTNYICALWNRDSGKSGMRAHLFYTDVGAGEEFARQQNGAGVGIYDCIGLLRDGAAARNKQEVVELDRIVSDLDLKNIAEPRDEVLKVLRDLVLSPSEIRDSGNGLHAIWLLKEPVVDEEGLRQAEEFMKRLAVLLAADPMPTHRAALLRRPGTDNTKFGNLKCTVIESSGKSCDISEFADMFDLYERPLLTLKDKPATNGHAGEWKPPLDVEERLATMQFEGPGDSKIHLTQLHVTGSLTGVGHPVEETVERVLAATQRAVANDPRCSNWDWAEERRDIERMCHDLINKAMKESGEDLSHALPDNLYSDWQRVIQEGKRPIVSSNGSGSHVRAYPWNREASDASNDEAKPEEAEEPRKKEDDGTFDLKWFEPINPADLPPRQYLYDRHYQRRVVSGDVAPGGTGKTSNGMVEAVAMATCRNLLGEQPEVRCRVWYHNGEDSLQELQRRLVAICEHYKIPQEELRGWLILTSGTELGLKVANGYNDLKIDRALVDKITKTVAKYQIDVFSCDPLITLHNVPEGDNNKMDAVIRIFTRIADVCDCSINLSHHTRKLLVGEAREHGVDDARGASAIRDAVRSLRVFNVMSAAEGSRFGMDEYERLSYFRVDKGKANTVKPASRATWRKFEDVALANGDNVGVVTQWNNPDATPEGMAEAERRAEDVFLRLLDRLSEQGRHVHAAAGPNYAPAVMAKEPAAKEAGVGKAALVEAMRRLFAARALEVESYGNRGGRRIVRSSPPVAPTQVD
jgi:RecA-family ATPase